MAGFFLNKWSFYLLPLLWVGCSAGLPAQQTEDDPFRLLYTVPEPAVFLAADHLQQLYIVNGRQELVKFDARGREQFRFHNNLLGAPQRLDVTNPMNLLVFFPKYNRVQLLDRTLSEVSSLDLLSLGVVQSAVVGMSRDNHLWVYDAQQFLLKKIDQGGQMLLSSEPLNLVLGGQAPVPAQVIEKNQRVYLVDPQTGILEFDLFATYLRTIPLKGVDQIQLVGEHLYFQREGDIVQYGLTTFQETLFHLPEALKGFEQVCLQKGRLFLLKEGRVSVYQLP